MDTTKQLSHFYLMTEAEAASETLFLYQKLSDGQSASVSVESTFLLTSLNYLTPRNKVLLEKLTVAQSRYSSPVLELKVQHGNGTSSSIKDEEFPHFATITSSKCILFHSIIRFSKVNTKV
jgi:hypothetical protein